MRLRVCLLYGATAAIAGSIAAAGHAAEARTGADAQSDASLAAPRVTIKSLELGFSGVFKVGHFIPARVQIQNSAQQPQVVQAALLVPDDRGVPCRFHSGEVQFAANEIRDVLLYVKIGRPRGAVLVECAGIEQEFHFGPSGSESVGRSIAATDELIVTLGPDVGVGDALKLGASDLGWQAHSVEIEDAQKLPDDWQGFDGVDTLVLSTADAEFYDALLQTAPQRAAIDDWLNLGGRMLVCGGRRAPLIFGDAEQQVVSLPARLAEMVPLRTTSAIESYADTSAPIDVSPLTERLMLPRLESVQGEAEAWAGNRPGELPFVIRAPHGFGELTFVALDLDRPPLAKWEGRPRMVNRLLGRQSRRLATPQRGSQGAVKTIGYSEMSGQLRAALGQFQGVTFVSFWIVAVLIGLYAAAIGPLDYWLVHRVLGKPNATWFTFLFWGLLFAGIGTMATLRLKGNEARLRQVELIDYDLSRQPEPNAGQGGVAVRWTVWLNFFAPRAAAYDFTARPSIVGTGRNVGPVTASLTWNGLAGAGLGGMQTSDTSQPEWSHAYDAAGQPARLTGIPMHAWSTQSLLARGASQVTRPLNVQLAEIEDGLLTGGFENRLGVGLSDASLFYDRWVYKLGSLATDQELKIDSKLKPLDMRTLLTRQEIVGDSDRAKPYSRESIDIARILEIQMFYALAGGEAYAQLDNRYQPSVDLSHLIRDGRAILIARLDSPASRLEAQPIEVASDNRATTTFVRFVLPVTAK